MNFIWGCCIEYIEGGLICCLSPFEQTDNLLRFENRGIKNQNFMNSFKIFF